MRKEGRKDGKARQRQTAEPKFLNFALQTSSSSPSLNSNREHTTSLQYCQLNNSLILYNGNDSMEQLKIKGSRKARKKGDRWRYCSCTRLDRPPSRVEIATCTATERSILSGRSIYQANLGRGFGPAGLMYSTLAGSGEFCHPFCE